MVWYSIIFKILKQLFAPPPSPHRQYVVTYCKLKSRGGNTWIITSHPALTRKTPTDTPLEVNSMMQSVLHTHRCTHTHALTGNSAGGKQHDPVLALTCVVLPKILATTQPTSIIFVSFTLSQESPVLKKASHPTSIRDADWYQSLFQQEATQPSAQSSFTLREPI